LILADSVVKCANLTCIEPEELAYTRLSTRVVARVIYIKNVASKNKMTN